MQVVSRVTLHPAAGVTLRPAPVRHCRPPVVQRAARTQRGSTRLSKCRVRCFVSTDQQRNVDTLEAASKAPEDAAAASPTQQPVNSASEANAVPLVEDQRTSSAAEPLAESSLAAGQSDDGAAVQAEATSQQSEENTEAAGPNEEGTSKEKALKSVKWQLRHADTVQKVLYVMGQPRNAQEWDDSSNITTALKTLNREILNSTNKRVALMRKAEEWEKAQKVRKKTRKLHPAASQGYKGKPTGVKGVRRPTIGRTPIDLVREKPQLKKSLEDFTQIVQQRAPRMRRSALALVEQYVSRLSAIGFNREMAAVQKTVQEEQRSRTVRMKAKAAQAAAAAAAEADRQAKYEADRAAAHEVSAASASE
mmetsp:Transcript_11457/g.34428  ORF Transcript_11457/g.34428 Transcript_11457/m.34428 type:complete len:364 (-) Transcript_11457:714-1805(-)